MQSKELTLNSVVRKFRTTAVDGKSYDIATRFRQWATVRPSEY